MTKDNHKLCWWQRFGRYHMRVPVNEGRGPTVVLLHGIGSSSVYWQKTIDKLYKDHHVIAVDMLGFGTSPKPGHIRYSAEDQSRALRRTLLMHGVWGKITLVGFSLGSLVAVDYATRHPQQINKLVLVSLPIYLNKTQFSDEQLGGWQAVLTSRLNATYLKIYRQMRRQPKLTKNVASAYRKALPKMAHMDMDGELWFPFAMSLQNTIEHQNTLNQLKQLHMPIEILYGKYDPMFIKTNLAYIKKAASKAKVEVLATGHEIPKKMPIEVVKAIKQ